MGRRIRNFPSLVNCCTIDWFTEWPEDALFSVAKTFLGKIEMDTSDREKCITTCVKFHRETKKWSDKFLSEMRRHYYVTPTS